MAIQVKPRGARAASTQEGSNALEVTVTDLSNRLKRTVEDTFGSVRVRGEISGYRGPVSSGHMYFGLKDDRSMIDAVVWRGVAGKLSHRPEEGLEVIASGRLTTYGARSKYQLVIDNIEVAGEGALMAQLERLRKKLLAEGLFEASRKRRPPFMPRVVGVVTSPTGAVIRDILHRVRERFPVHVIVWPVRVQGETTPEEVSRAIEGFNAFERGGPIARPDVLIVARGGGSLEDLWGFNDERVVRAAAASAIPLVSAVGHETDTTLIDHASDLRAPTPTAAAEFVVPVRADEAARVAERAARLSNAAARALDRRRTHLEGLTRGLRDPDALLALPRRRFDEAAGRLDRALERRAERARARLERVAARMTPGRLAQSLTLRSERLRLVSSRRDEAWRRRASERRERLRASERGGGQAISATLRLAQRSLRASSRGLRPEPLTASLGRGDRRLNTAANRLAQGTDLALRDRTKRLEAGTRLLESLSFKGVLARGYALLRDEDGAPVRSASDLSEGARFTAQVRDGTIGAIVDGAEVEPRPRAKAKARPRKEDAPGRSGAQGDLF